jgi:hypothetical protein
MCEINARRNGGTAGPQFSPIKRKAASNSRVSGRAAKVECGP